MMDLLEIANEIKSINDYCCEEYQTDGEVLIARITRLNVYLARSGEMQALTQYYYDVKLGEEAEIIEEKHPKIAPMKLKNLLAGKVARENKILKYCERTNRAIVHQLDAIRSQLSYLKVERVSGKYAEYTK
ncbi:MAG: hypothetical protein GY853_09430 [PVC group bacterium]|nr:hypothetical protein [PVC group bacterium]